MKIQLLGLLMELKLKTPMKMHPLLDLLIEDYSLSHVTQIQLPGLLTELNQQTSLLQPRALLVALKNC